MTVAAEEAAAAAAVAVAAALRRRGDPPGEEEADAERAGGQSRQTEREMKKYPLQFTKRIQEECIQYNNTCTIRDKKDIGRKEFVSRFQNVKYTEQ